METSIENFVRTAYEVGMPKDQLELFVKYQYVPLRWQMIFHKVARDADSDGGPVDIGVGGARGPGKSHGVFAQVTLDDCQRIKGLKGLFLRQTGKAAKESFEDLIESVLKRRIEYNYNSSNGMIKFSNGSRVLLGGFDNEDDIDKYVGIQYDLMAVEELNQLTEEKVIKLKGSLRTAKEGWRPRLYASFNPGGIGNAFIKTMFVEPHREGREQDTRFIPSNYKNNPYLNKEYISYLENLGGNLGRAWREGDFNIFEGQFFSEWREQIHTIEPFVVPDTWKRIRTIDHGRTNPTACMWGAIDCDGNVFFYREYYKTGVDADVNAQEIARLSQGERYSFTVLDSACFSKQGHGETIAEIYQRNGVACEPWPKNRIAGWALFHEYLRHDTNSQPKMKFFKTLVNAIKTIPTLIHDEHRPEDLNSDGPDHIADAVRGFMEYFHESKSPPEKNEVQKMLEKLKQKDTINPSNLNQFYNKYA